LLSVPSADRYPEVELPPLERRQKTLQALGKYLQALARERPVLMIFEDVHWIDPTSLEALTLTVENVRGMQALLVVIFRPEFNPPWTGQSHVTPLTLNRLDQSDVATIVERIASGNAHLQGCTLGSIDACHGVNECQSCPDRPLSIVLLGPRIAEIGEYAVSHIFGDKAPRFGNPDPTQLTSSAKLA
jgi:hypothetical protein